MSTQGFKKGLAFDKQGGAGIFSMGKLNKNLQGSTSKKTFKQGRFNTK